MRKALQAFSHSQAGQQGAHKMVMEELHKRGQGCGGTFVELGSLDGVSHVSNGPLFLVCYLHAATAIGVALREHTDSFPWYGWHSYDTYHT